MSYAACGLNGALQPGDWVEIPNKVTQLSNCLPRRVIALARSPEVP